MNTRDLQNFNDGFDHAVKVMAECKSCAYACAFVQGFRYDRWWREGVDMAIQWAERNWVEANKQLVGYRQAGKGNL